MDDEVCSGCSREHERVSGRVFQKGERQEILRRGGRRRIRGRPGGGRLPGSSSSRIYASGGHSRLETEKRRI